MQQQQTPTQFTRQSEDNTLTREIRALQRVTELENSFMVCFAIFTKMGVSGDVIKTAKASVRNGQMPRVEIPAHLQPIAWNDSLFPGLTMELQDWSHVAAPSLRLLQPWTSLSPRCHPSTRCLPHPLTRCTLNLA